MIAAFIQIACYQLVYKKFEKLHIFMLVTVLVLGSATIYFQDERFLKWKPTAVGWVFALLFLGSHVFGKKTLLERLIGMLGDKAPIPLPTAIWRKLNAVWGCFFIFTGCLNLYVAYTFNTEFWVNFKTWGMTLVNLAFMIAVCVYLYTRIYKYHGDEDEKTLSQEE